MSEGSIIGTLSEGAVHSFVKAYIEPREQMQEVSYLGYVADIKNEDGITEVQTSSFERLRDKLQAFLENDTLTLVCPIISRKTLISVNSEGEVGSVRKSPKSVKPIALVSELYKIRDFLSHPRLTLKILELSCIEYRPIGKAQRRKMKERRVEEVLGQTVLRTPEDYRALLLPPDINGEFFASEYIKKSGIKSRPAYCALGVLTELGIIEKCEKRGRAFIYRTVNR
ncbi:MAG: hypothetical protein IIX96_03395 [Clostridia bacterium]|nr:hypothetical protein [Clostridia bacterium]